MNGAGRWVGSLEISEALCLCESGDMACGFTLQASAQWLLEKHQGCSRIRISKLGFEEG